MADAKQVREILRKEQLSPRMKRIPTYANAVYWVGDDLILKVYDSESEWTNTCRAYSYIHRHRLPAPTIVASGKSPSPYILMTHLDGRPMTDGAGVAEYRSFGRWVGKLHQIRFKQFGGLQERGIGKFHELNKGPFKTWKQMHLALIDDRMKGFEKTILAQLIPRIGPYFENAKYPAFRPTLIHEDLNAKNVFVKNGRVVGVIDPDGAFAGCTEEELMRTEIAHFEHNPELRAAFFKGYRQYSTLLPGYEARRPLFYLSRTLVEASCLINLKGYKAGHKKEAMREVYRIIDETTSPR